MIWPIGQRDFENARAAMTGDDELLPRFEGVDIRFTLRYRYPGFLIRCIVFSRMTVAGGSVSGYALEGEISGLTNEHQIYGDPLRVHLRIDRERKQVYALRAVFYRTLPCAPRGTLRMSATNILLGTVRLPQRRGFPSALFADRADFHFGALSHRDSAGFGQILEAAPIHFVFADSTRGRIGCIIQDVLAGVHWLKLATTLSRKAGAYRIKMHSNGDRVVAEGVKSAIADNLPQAQSALEARVRQKIEPHKQQAAARIEQFRQSVAAQVKLMNRNVAREFELIERDKAEIEARIVAEKQKSESAITGAKARLGKKRKKPSRT